VASRPTSVRPSTAPPALPTFAMLLPTS
jgi:hypothetical protein